MYDFAVDVSKITDLITNLKDKAHIVEDQIRVIEEGINGLQEAWDGSSYQTFKAKCEEFYPAMHSLPIMLKAYSWLFENSVSTAEEKLGTKLQQVFTNSN